MAATWFEQGVEEGHRRLLRLQLEKCFGPLTPQAKAKIETWPPERVEKACLALLDGQSLDDLGLGEDKLS
jgi:hypothetical protein